MRKLICRTSLVLVVAALGHSQTFEVASIKVVPPSAPRGPVRIEPTPGNLVMRYVGIGELVSWAYKVGPPRVSNPQVLMDSRDRFDVIAKAAGPATTDEMRVMLQALLTERFKLAAHFETKEVTAFALVEAKGGHKLKISETPDGKGVLPIEQPGRMALGAQGATLDQLAMFLSMPLRAPVVDMTGLKGRYDFEFDLTTFMPQKQGPPAPGEGQQEQMDPVSVLQAALPKQLGLKLESRKLPVDMLVIDHLEKVPTEN
jgi:uncharacterized protein (TIGR03435 family)